MTKASILQHFKQYVQKQHQSGNNINKNMERIFAAIKSASEEDIVFGECPSYFRAYIECNSTGVGTSSFEGTKTQRTVALDYTTDQYLFVDGHEGAAVKGLEIFYLKPGETMNYYRKDCIKDVATNYGLNLHMQKFRDLNFLISNHRLNRYTVKITEGPFSYPIRPIYLSMTNNKRPVLIGYTYTMNKTDYILVDFKEVNTSKKKHSYFSSWMLLGLFFPPLLLIALFVVIYRVITE